MLAKPIDRRGVSVPAVAGGARLFRVSGAVAIYYRARQQPRWKKLRCYCDPPTMGQRLAAGKRVAVEPMATTEREATRSGLRRRGRLRLRRGLCDRHGHPPEDEPARQRGDGAFQIRRIAAALRRSLTPTWITPLLGVPFPAMPARSEDVVPAVRTETGLLPYRRCGRSSYRQADPHRTTGPSCIKDGNGGKICRILRPRRGDEHRITAAWADERRRRRRCRRREP